MVVGCWRRAKRGKLVCIDHQRTGLGKELGREVAKLERGIQALLMETGQDASDRAATRFRRQVERGEFAALFAGRMKELFDEHGRAGAFDDEIGALRIAMMRLLLEESDPARLAKGLSQVTNATVRAVKAQQEIDEPHVSATMLERSIERVERSARELGEEGVLEREERAWKKAVGWNAEMEKAWRSPENQRRLVEEGTREAIERMERRWAVRGRREDDETGRRGEEHWEANDAADSHEHDAEVAKIQEEIAALSREFPYEWEAPGGVGESASRQVGESVSSEGSGGKDERSAESGEQGTRRYANELERLFWESDDPLAYHRELRRQMEEGGE